MRDYKFEKTFYPSRLDNIDVIKNPGIDSYPISSSEVPYHLLRVWKGRDLVTTGPSPYPTNYYAFDCKVSFQVGKHTERGRWTVWTSAGRDRELYETTYMPFWRESALFEGCKGFIYNDGSISKNGFKPDVSYECIGIARNSAISNLRSSKVNLGQSFGEAAFLLPGFLRNVVNLGKILLALRKGKLAKARRDAKKYFGYLFTKRGLTKAWASTQLFLQFGLYPILNDIEHSANEIGKSLQFPSRTTIKGKSAIDRDCTQNFYSDSVSGSYLEVCEVGYTILIDARISQAFLGLSNPLGTAWELVPLSFVINWFISIGDMINAIDANMGVTVVSGYQTTVVKGSKKLHSYYNVQDSEVTSEFFAMKREILPNSVQNPGLFVKTNLNRGQVYTLGLLIRAFT